MASRAGGASPRHEGPSVGTLGASQPQPSQRTSPQMQQRVVSDVAPDSAYGSTSDSDSGAVMARPNAVRHRRFWAALGRRRQSTSPRPGGQSGRHGGVGWPCSPSAAIIDRMANDENVNQISSDDPAAASLVAAIRAGDVGSVREVVAREPDLASARLTGPKGGSETSLHVVSGWPGYYPNGPGIALLLIQAGARLGRPPTG